MSSAAVAIQRSLQRHAFRLQTLPYPRSLASGLQQQCCSRSTWANPHSVSAYEKTKWCTNYPARKTGALWEALSSQRRLGEQVRTLSHHEGKEPEREAKTYVENSSLLFAIPHLHSRFNISMSSARSFSKAEISSKDSSGIISYFSKLCLLDIC